MVQVLLTLPEYEAELLVKWSRKTGLPPESILRLGLQSMRFAVVTNTSTEDDDKAVRQQFRPLRSVK